MQKTCVLEKKELKISKQELFEPCGFKVPCFLTVIKEPWNVIEETIKICFIAHFPNHLHQMFDTSQSLHYNWSEKNTNLGGGDKLMH